MAFVDLGPADADAILDLITAIEVADGVPLRTSQAEVEEFFDSALTWRATGLWEGERLIAFGLARMFHHGGEVRLSGGVHPESRGRGIGKILASRQVDAARDIGGATAIVHVDSSNNELAEILESDGFTKLHEYMQLRKSVKNFPVFPTPPQIVIERLTPERDSDVIAFHNVAQAQAGGESMNPELWRAEHRFIDRDWSFVAYDVRGDRPRVAAYIVCERYEEEWGVLGWSEGYISEVALGEEWRGLNLVSALLTKCVESIRAVGVDYIGVDMQDGDYLLSTFIDRGFERTGIASVYSVDL